jgi:hypothetical protein
MKTIIDTNILYYLTKIDGSIPDSINFEILEQQVESLEPISISELTLLEICTHDSFSENDILKLFNYIEANQMEIIYEFKEYPIDYFNYDNFEGLKEKTLNKKQYLEYTHLPSVIISLLQIMYLIFDNRIESGIARDMFKKGFQDAIEGNVNYIEQFCKTIIENYYKDLNLTKFKDSLDKEIYLLFHLVKINVALAENNVTLDKLIESKTSINLKLNNTESNEIAKNILKKLKGQGRGILEKKEFWKKLDSNIQLVFGDIPDNIFNVHFDNIGAEAYYRLYSDFFFKTGKKFEKNNLIDALFYKYYSKFNFITLDSFLKDSIEKINPQLYQTIEEFQKRVKSV